MQIISIHALLTESDWYSSASSWLRIYFYPRSPYGERQPHFPCTELYQHFYPRSPYGERHLAFSHRPVNVHFYPRSPYGERRINNVSTIRITRFLSTLSLRRATQHGKSHKLAGLISIHALLTESDTVLLIQLTRKQDFYPRSPYGERQQHFENLPI